MKVHPNKLTHVLMRETFLIQDLEHNYCRYLHQHYREERMEEE